MITFQEQASIEREEPVTLNYVLPIQQEKEATKILMPIANLSLWAQQLMFIVQDTSLSDFEKPLKELMELGPSLRLDLEYEDVGRNLFKKQLVFRMIPGDIDVLTPRIIFQIQIEERKGKRGRRQSLQVPLQVKSDERGMMEVEVEW